MVLKISRTGSNAIASSFFKAIYISYQHQTPRKIQVQSDTIASVSHLTVLSLEKKKNGPGGELA